ncbi:hypothetical protein GCM10027317_48690 [Massilia agri]|jgi:hypothetical protein
MGNFDFYLLGAGVEALFEGTGWAGSGVALGAGLAGGVGM